MSDRRLLLVHAHPDDESINNGATMAKYAAEGAHVTLVTCTLGEEGEVIPPELRDLAADREDRLGAYRIGELERACAALGVKDHRFLGGAGRWRDSGMMGAPTNDRPGAFWRADLDEAAAELVTVIREVRPQVLVTYDENGFYGHPDHIQAHRVARRAAELAAAPGHGDGEPWTVAKFYYTTVARSVIENGIEAARAAGTPFTAPDALPYGVPDETITTEIDATAYLPAKLAAMRAHATQITVAEPWYALSNGLAQLASGVEQYILVGGAPPSGDREDDLFHGID
ncbi:N-acetyl-1-D-myo-inositol-2-amino-2-deoxy-alpha-D-glucopyranoside deacetylase [Bailinhaonella thermotolerans]|uniref:1D-myo-inositol 2-acetamido-2-deoxy-alpha-D-glucopyranoside deacetylase n=1 Tax=Bailinhaonella thermotolerans TaxID=1070861 RepID=A0A3A4ATV3_9ACTN|nr:N-acetyl-1-D-myo-inositol-2-amino-2-deoxy-alpha-D-glucopyranoside deacetylase [Bailinhaonella thermotolerans]RJL33420.1 N-acetyl-1-D-myo-inositol-2-amino-2-deoxy-alpha-D-glucopyranoside deacetylase [Bailinhaonella thermotolerans]